MKCRLRLESYRWSLAVFLSAASLALLDDAVPAAPNDTRPQVITPNEFEGTDVERINLAIAAAAEVGGRVVIPRDNLGGQPRRDVWLIDSAILLRSQTTLELDNCRIKLSDRACSA